MVKYAPPNAGVKSAAQMAAEVFAVSVQTELFAHMTDLCVWQNQSKSLWALLVVLMSFASDTSSMQEARIQIQGGLDAPTTSA